MLGAYDSVGVSVQIDWQSKKLAASIRSEEPHYVNTEKADQPLSMAE